MRVIIAHTAGFCMGVRRAMNKAFITMRREEGPIYTHGPLIHNPQVVKLLNERGVREIHDASEASDGTVILRAHGITPWERKNLKQSNLSIVDATCPKVGRVHAAVRKHHAQGYLVVVVGDQDHPEVVGIVGHTDGTGLVVNTPAEAAGLPDVDRVLVVAQTTFEEGRFSEILDAIRARYRGLEVKAINTICQSTMRRQEEVRHLAQRVDAMVVVGGKNSGNTRRLVEVAVESGVPAFHIEDVSDLDADVLCAYGTVGLTAGASTPNWVIMEVADHLSHIDRKERRPIWSRAASMMRFLVLTSIFASISAGGLATAAAVLMGVNSFFVIPLISGLLIFTMYVLNRTQDREALKFNDPLREALYTRYKTALSLSGVVTFAVSLLLAFMISGAVVVLLVAATLMGIAYSVKVVPESFERFTRYRRLKDIPASKTFFVAGAWAAIAGAVPYFSAIDRITFMSFLAVFFIAFLLVFIRAALYDIRDIQGDAVVGRETIPIVIGKGWTQRLLVVLTALVMCVLIVSTATGLVTSVGWWLLIIPFYTFCVLYLYHRRVIFQGIVFELVVDFGFILAGMTSLVWFLYTRPH
ncbi:MAG: 4-hydroxy-3-methylbut-2-enyl diphosphate reductase [Deltaproteobacteria bacterium]|nr:4-hydroxy-3-methylbut-2-enyl diphosphate reductase [Candidatus Zymogenaceae bacterium]